MQASVKPVKFPVPRCPCFFLSRPESPFHPSFGGQVSFGGQSIPLVQFGTSGNDIIMAGDISTFAGQTGELLFVGRGLFDDIQFSDMRGI